MTRKNKIIWSVIAAAIALLAVIIPEVISYVPRILNVEGTVTSVDAPGRQASLEVVVPWSGKRKEITGQVSEDCQIHINGQQAELKDVRIGDQVQATIRWVSATQEKRPLSIKITRTATTKSGAASQPATAAAP